MTLQVVHNKRCNSRLREACVSCAGLWYGDNYRIGRDGLRNGNLQYIMVTATLPSCGPVHFRGKKFPKRCHCGALHRLNDPLLATPVDPSAFDYERLVRGNATIRELQRRTMSKLRRVTAAVVSFWVQPHVAWFGAAEHQDYGAVHLHMVVALNVLKKDLRLYRDGSRNRSAFIEGVFTGMKSKTVIGGESFIMKWGNVLAEWTPDPSRDVSISYILKNTGVRSPFLGSGGYGPTGQHRARAQEVAHRLISMELETGEIKPSTAAVRYERTAAGWTGNPVTQSRNWSDVTLSSCRQERGAHARKGQSPTGASSPDFIWRYIGHSHFVPERAAGEGAAFPAVVEQTCTINAPASVTKPPSAYSILPSRLTRNERLSAAAWSGSETFQICIGELHKVSVVHGPQRTRCHRFMAEKSIVHALIDYG